MMPGDPGKGSSFRRASTMGPKKLVRTGSGEFGASLARTGSGSSAASKRSASGGFGEGGLDSFCDLVSPTHFQSCK